MRRLHIPGDRFAKKRSALVALMLSTLLILSACGTSKKSAEPTATVPAMPPTLAPGEVTVDSLLKRIDSGWAATTSMSSTSWTAPASDPLAGIGTPPTDQMVTVERVVKPSTRSISTSIGGAVVDDQVAIDGSVYFRGTSVTDAIAPFVDAATWVKVNPRAVGPDTPVGQQLSYLMAPPSPPYGTVSADLRARGATNTGQVKQGDRTCDVFTFRDSADDSGIAYTLAIDSKNLPCFLMQSGGGYANITTWTFDDPTIVIAAPAGAIDVTGTPTPPA